jgi:hypothetical protein
MHSQACSTPFVKNSWASAQIRSEGLCPISCNELGYPAVWVVKITEYSYLGWASGNTGWFSAGTNQINAKPTLHHYPLMMIQGTHLVRARLYAVLAAHASVLVYKDHAFW